MATKKSKTTKPKKTELDKLRELIVKDMDETYKLLNDESIRMYGPNFKEYTKKERELYLDSQLKTLHYVLEQIWNLSPKKPKRRK